MHPSSLSAPRSRTGPRNPPGTTPAIWTGVEHAPQGHGEKGDEERACPIGSWITELKTPELGFATAEFLFNGGFATLTVKVHLGGVLTPDSTACTSTRRPSASGTRWRRPVAPPATSCPAGGRFQAPGHTGYPMSGDLASLQVKGDSTGSLVTTTDAFTAAEQLLAGNKTALIIHEKADNFGNIPADRYQQIQGAAPKGGRGLR